MEPLTRKQKKVLDFIAERLAEHEPPSQREIGDHFGMVQNSVYQLVGYLKAKGYVISVGGHRGLRLSEEYLRVMPRAEGIPVVGRVAAGEPILAEENIDHYIDLGQMFKRSEDTFALKVAGDSMVDEGIMDGDYVVVRSTSRVRSGQIAVVMLDDEATVKRVFVQKNRIALKPANRRAGYKTRYVKEFDKEVRVVGRVIGCVRTEVK